MAEEPSQARSAPCASPWEDGNADGVIDAGEDLIEVSLNYFAQNQDGTVCYFGEAVDMYEGGEIVSHGGLGAAMCVASLGLIAPGAAAQTWTETPDAGELPASA
jgi:hypothetical protein